MPSTVYNPQYEEGPERVERIHDKDGFIFVSAADQMIAREKATKPLEGNKATIWKCISCRLERTVAGRVNRTAAQFYIQQNRLTTAGNTLLWSTAFHILTVNSYCSQNWRDFELDQTLHKMLALCFTVSYCVAVHCSQHQISCYSAALHVACVGV